MNGHLFTRRGVTFGASLGFTVAINGDSIEPGIIIGPSFGLRKNTVWITTGLNVTRVSRLGGGFHPGDTIPTGLQDPLPVEKHAIPGFAFGITYKIR